MSEIWEIPTLIGRDTGSRNGNQGILPMKQFGNIFVHETKMAKNLEPDYDKAGDDGEVKVKIICLGDSAVGKSK